MFIGQLLLLSSLVGGCGASGEEPAADSQLALAEGVGEPCASEAAGSRGTNVVTAPVDCNEGQVCVSIGEGVEEIAPTEGSCSCRCDGPEAGMEPFCRCSPGFDCVPLIEDLGLSYDDSLVGSYCLARSAEL